MIFGFCLVLLLFCKNFTPQKSALLLLSLFALQKHIKVLQKTNPNNVDIIKQLFFSVIIGSQSNEKWSKHKLNCTTFKQRLAYFYISGPIKNFHFNVRHPVFWNFLNGNHLWPTLSVKIGFLTASLQRCSPTLGKGGLINICSDFFFVIFSVMQ